MNPERVCYGCFTEKEPGIPCPRCGFNENDEQPYLALPLGTILNGRYLVGKVLGIGGFGITYLGYDLTLEIKVAIKEYMPSALATRHPDHYSVALTGRVEEDYQYGMERFLDEAKILAKLQNTPHIVSVQNYFKENGTAYFVMEYIDGMSLKAYLAKNGDKIPYNQAIAILQPIMEALVQVHALNLLHRDISPDNIYITSKGESRLLDFGAARFALGDGKSVSVILKHGYAPEEQYSSHGNQGPWTDVYAMGATLYRCITGQLPPDSVERIHGDTMKRPSELGFRIPANVENAIMKALAVKTEDRFPNMEAFIGALNGRVSVQDQVAASISQRTQATAYRQEGYGQTAYQQPAYNGGGAAAGKPSAFSRFLSYMKANPVVAWVSGGGLLAVIALCIILPIALSGGGEKRPTGGGGGGNTPVISQPQTSNPPVISQPQTSNPEPTTDPEPTTEPPAEMVAQDLGILNATIEIPSDYTRVEEETIFINEAKGCGMMMDYLWNIDGPIYSLADVESQREAIAANLMQNLFEVSDYQILAAGPDQVGSAGAYQIYLEGTDSEGVSNEVVIMAVEGYDFGCYFIITSYPKGDKAAEAEIHSIIQSFESNGAPETTYKMYYGSKSGVKVIVDDAVAAGRVMDTTVNLGEAGAAAELVIYPTDAAMEAGFGSATPDSGIVEIGNAGQLGMSSPEEVLQFQRDVASSAGVSVGETYTSQSGGVEWLCMDWTMNEFTFSVASAMIDGKCYAVSCMFNSSNKDAVVALYQQAMASVRAWTSNPEPTTDPEPTTEPPAEMVAQDLGIFNATIEIPSDYTRVEEETIFINEAKGCGIMVDYFWNIDGPIYSLADVESQREAIAANLMQNPQILAAGPDQVGSAGAYQIYLEGTDSEGVSSEVVIMAVEGYDFGCYFIITFYPKGDKAAEAEIHSIIQSFKSNGAPETTYKMYYGSKSGVKVIVDDAVAAGRVMDTTVNLGEAGAAAELVIYPTDAAMEAGFGSATPDSGIVEIGNAGQLGMSSPEEVLQFQRDVASSAGVSVGETYTSQSGGVEWLCMDWTMNEFTFSVASAMIDGKCYAVSCMFNSSNKDAVVALLQQAMKSVRAWEG